MIDKEISPTFLAKIGFPMAGYTNCNFLTIAAFRDNGPAARILIKHGAKLGIIRITLLNKYITIKLIN